MALVLVPGLLITQLLIGSNVGAISVVVALTLSGLVFTILFLAYLLIKERESISAQSVDTRWRNVTSETVQSIHKVGTPCAALTIQAVVFLEAHYPIYQRKPRFIFPLARPI